MFPFAARRKKMPATREAQRDLPDFLRLPAVARRMQQKRDRTEDGGPRGAPIPDED